LFLVSLTEPLSGLLLVLSCFSCKAPRLSLMWMSFYVLVKSRPRRAWVTQGPPWLLFRSVAADMILCLDFFVSYPPSVRHRLLSSRWYNSILVYSGFYGLSLTKPVIHKIFHNPERWLSWYGLLGISLPERLENWAFARFPPLPRSDSFFFRYGIFQSPRDDLFAAPK